MQIWALSLFLHLTHLAKTLLNVMLLTEAAWVMTESCIREDS